MFLILNQRSLRSVFRSAVAFALFVIGEKCASSQPSVAPPQKIWVSLSYSTLDTRAPNWKWLRLQCARGQVLNTLKPVLNKIGGVVVPIFDGGQCFYSTSIEPFKGRNSETAANEKARVIF